MPNTPNVHGIWCSTVKDKGNKIIGFYFIQFDLVFSESKWRYISGERGTDAFHCNAFSHLIYTSTNFIGFVGSQQLQHCFHLIWMCDCIRVFDAGEYQKWIGRTLCVCILLMLEIMSSFFLAFLCFLGHWCDYIGVRYGARALYNFVFRLDFVLLSLTRIVSTSTYYHLNCHRIESCDATRIRISCEPCTPMGMGHYCGDISLWTSIVWDIWNYDFIHRCWVLRECDSQSMKIYDCITYTCGCIFLPGTFFQLKNVCEFFDNAFFMNTKRIPWFGNQVEKKNERKMNRVEKHIILGSQVHTQ